MKTFCRRTADLFGFLSPSEMKTTLEQQQTRDVSQKSLGSQSTWPSVSDSFTACLFSQFQLSVLPMRNSTIKHHLALIWITQLRFQCGLRGIKPSQLLGSWNATSLMFSLQSLHLADCIQNFSNDLTMSTFQLMCSQFTFNVNNVRSFVEVNRIENPGVDDVRREFLYQSLRKLPIDSFTVAYNAAGSLDIDGDDIRVLHVTSLLERCSASADQIADETIAHVRFTLHFLFFSVSCSSVS